MKFREIKGKIINNPGFKTLKEIKQAGWEGFRRRIFKASNKITKFDKGVTYEKSCQV